MDDLHFLKNMKTIILFTCLLFTSCNYTQKTNSALNILFPANNSTIPVYNYSLNQDELKASLQAQVPSTSINSYGDCNTLVKIGFGLGDTLRFPFFGRHFYTPDVKMDSRCFWNAPIRIHIKKDNILFNGHSITMENLTNVLQTDRHLFFKNSDSKDCRLEINWDTNSKLVDRRQILSVLINQIESIYNSYSEQKFGLSLDQLNNNQIQLIKAQFVKFKLYHSFNNSSKKHIDILPIDSIIHNF